MQREPSYYKQELLIERIADVLGFKWLSEWLDKKTEIVPKIPPSYLLVATALFIDMGIFDTLNRFTGKNSVVQDPGKLFITVGLIVAVVGVRWMHDSYAQAVTGLQLPERNVDNIQKIEKSFKTIPRFKLTIVVYFLALIIHFERLFLHTGLQRVIEIEGLLRAVVGNLVIWPLVTIPLMIEFGLLYFSIHFLLPRRIDQADLNMFFYDPQNLGGFGSVGQLLKKSYYLYTTGLLLYFVMAYWSLLFNNLNLSTPYPEPGTFTAVLFTVLWVIGVLSIAYSMYRMHVLMSRKRDRAIREVEAEIKALLNEPYDITVDHIDDPDTRAEFEHKIAQIRATKRYPSTFTMWSQIAISVLLPQGLQVALNVL